jgi:hypothetical protein
MVAQYRSRPFGSTGTSRPEVSNIVRSSDPDVTEHNIVCDWRVDAAHMLLDLPPSSMYQMDRLLFRPVLFSTLLHLEGEARPCMLRLPSVVCRPHFISGKQEYRCTFPVVLPMHVLKEVVNESDLGVVIELSLRRMRLNDADAAQFRLKMNADRARAGLPPVDEAEFGNGVSDEEEEEEASLDVR